MNKSLLYFSILILVSNFLFFVVGVLANISFVGTFMGGLMAIGTDPVILMLGALLGAGLVAKPFRFSVIYLVISAIFLTMLVHVILGTTRFIVDVVRFDALLIIPSIIIVVASFFGPKSKPTKAKLIKVDPSTLKAIRLLILIFSAALSGFILFADTSGYSHRITDTLFGKYVSKSLIRSLHHKTTLTWCENKEDITTCKKYVEDSLFTSDELFKSGKITREEIIKQIDSGDIKVSKYPTGNYRVSMWITHIILFIIFMVIVFKLRFCIAHVLLTRTETVRTDTKSGGSNLSKTIKKFFKNI